MCVLKFLNMLRSSSAVGTCSPCPWKVSNLAWNFKLGVRKRVGVIHPGGGHEDLVGDRKETSETGFQGFRNRGGRKLMQAADPLSIS